MRKGIAWLAGAALLSVLLCGCQGQADQPAEAQQSELPAEQIAARWLMEEGHQAARVGDRLVTVNVQEAENEYGHEAVFTLWDPALQDAPLQTMTAASEEYGRCEVNDANFDGEPDLGWMYFSGNQPRNTTWPVSSL